MLVVWLIVNRAVVDLIARALPQGLFHPGDDQTPSRVVPLPGFRTTGMGDEQAEEMIGAAAKVFAEAITHLIEQDYELMPKADAAQLRQDAADAPDGTRVITLFDRADHKRETPLLVLTVGKTDDVTIDKRQLRKLAQ